MEDMSTLNLVLQEINYKRGTQYEKLKPLQEKSILAASKSDVLSILPTGYGKSLIFEIIPVFHSTILALERPSSCAIVSPLNSIIQEQLNRYGDDALHISPQFVSNLKVHQSLGCSGECSCQDHNIKKFIECNFLFAIGHPEDWLSKPVFVSLRGPLLQRFLTHIVVDEAHCISKWGPAFRKDFANLQELRSMLPAAKVLALTATASKETKKDIKSTLVMSDCVVIQKCIRRANIKLSVQRRPNYSEGSEASFKEVIKPYIQELKEKLGSFPKTIVYSSLKWCGSGYEECTRVLSSGECRQLVSQYHAPCTSQMKEKVTESMKDAHGTRLLFATEAYGMGTDSPDIARVVHFGVPMSSETYLQEVGRAGRDGNPADGIMYYNNNDISKNISGLEPIMAHYCRTDQCRWEFLCNHFDCIESDDRDQHHTCCDNCALKCICDECKDLAAADIDDKTREKDSSLKKQLITTLCQYFKAENSVISLPSPSMCTGLTTQLAKEIAECGKSEEIRDKFSFLNDTYLDNIIAIVLSYDMQLQGDIN